MDRRQLETNLAQGMERLMSEVRSLTPSRWNEVDLTMPQARTLVYLSQGTKRMKELSAHLRSGMSSATSMVDRLVKKELVERVDDRTDRRVVAIRLTPKGEEVVDRFLRMGRMKYEAFAETLTDEEMAAAIEVVEMLLRAVRRGRTATSDEGRAAEAAPAQID